MSGGRVKDGWFVRKPIAKGERSVYGTGRISNRPTGKMQEEGLNDGSGARL